MRSRILLSQRILRALCVTLTLLGSMGNVGIAVSYPWAFPALGVPMPKDEHLFLVEAFVSLSLGLVALFALRRSAHAESLISLVILGKTLYALATFTQCAACGASTVFFLPVAWDALEIVLFFLFWIQAKGDDLFQLQLDVFEGIDAAGAASKRALLFRMPVAEGGSPGLDAVRAGLARRGYDVELAEIVDGPLALPDRRDWDLVVVESPDDLFAAAAPVDAMLRDPVRRDVFQGRDAAVVVISRGAHRRAMAAIAKRLQIAGANVVAARAWDDDAGSRGIFPKPVGGPGYRLSASARAEAESFGASLADRARTRPHWTLLVRDLRGPAEKRHG
jgi:hypothetical protein